MPHHLKPTEVQRCHGCGALVVNGDPYAVHVKFCELAQKRHTRLENNHGAPPQTKPKNRVKSKPKPRPKPRPKPISFL